MLYILFPEDCILNGEPDDVIDACSWLCKVLHCCVSGKVLAFLCGEG